MFKVMLTFLAVFMAALLLQACGNPSQLSDNQPPIPSTTQVSFVTGSYYTLIKGSDLHPQMTGDLPPHGATLGKWQLDFAEKGVFSLKRDIFEIIRGRYNLLAGNISFPVEGWEAYCPGTAPGEEATYAWSIETGALALNANHETCAFRLVVLSTHPLAFKEVVSGQKAGFNYSSLNLN